MANTTRETKERIRAEMSDTTAAVKNDARRAQEEAEDAADKIRDKAEETAAKLREKAREADDKLDETRRKAMNKADEKLDQAGEKMEDAADRLREHGDGGFTGRVARESANVLERSGHYLESTDIEDFRADAEEFVRRHPVQALAAGLAIGYLVGKTVRR